MSEPHPYRHLLVCQDRRQLLFVRDLQQLVVMPAPELVEPVERLLTTGLGPAPLLAMLERKGFWGRPGDLPEPWPEIRSERVWALTAFDTELPTLQVPPQVQTVGLASDGRRAVVYTRRAAADPCWHCFWARYLAHLDQGPALRRLLELSVRLPLQPVISAARWQQALEASAERPGEVGFWPEGSWLKVLPRPGCDCPLSDSHPGQTWLGPVTSCRPWHPPGRQPLWSATTGDTYWVTGRTAAAGGAGCAATAEGARGSALGEALERYAATWVADSFWDRLVESDRALVRHRYLPEQLHSPGFPMQAVELGLEVEFTNVEGLSRPGRHRALVEQVYLSREPFAGPSLDPGLSHGLACGPDLESALRAGLWELIERDAVALFWCAHHRGARATPRARRLDWPEEWELPGLRIECKALVGTARVVLVRGPEGGLGAGSAAGPDADRRAYYEALHNLEYLERNPGSDPGPSPLTFDEHLRYYWHRPQEFPWAQLEALPSGGRGRSNPALDSAQLARKLAARGWASYYKDLTGRDLRALGYAAVRVLCPGLLELPARHDAWPRALPRYRDCLEGAVSQPHTFG